MNRYSQISTSQFNPLSLEEVMAAPLYKQKQYDQLEADRVATQEAFKVDPLDVHKDEAQRLQNDFNAKADELARYQLKTGDLQGARSKMLDLRKEYKRLTNPMGDVSKINNANKTFQDEKIRYLEAASKQYGSTQALKLWNDYEKTYKGYDDKGNVKNIDSKGIVANQDFMKDVKEFHDLMGETSNSVAGSGYKIEKTPEGLIMVNSSGKTVTSNNFEQLKSAEKALKSKWIESTGEGTLYNIEAGKDLNEFKNYFTNTMFSQRKSGFNTDSNTSASFISGNGNDSGSESEDEIVSNESRLSSTTGDLETYADIHEFSQKNINSIDPVSKKMAQEGIKVRQVADSKLKNNKNYQKQMLELQNYEQQYGKNLSKINKGNSIQPEIEQQYKKLWEKYATLKDNVISIKNEAINVAKKSTLEHEYSYVPLNAAKEKIWKNKLENLANTFINTNDINNLISLERITTEDGESKDVGYNSQNVGMSLSKILKGDVDKNSFDIQFIPKLSNGKPGVKISFKTGVKGSSEDTEMEGSDNIGGENKTVSFTGALKEMTNVRGGSAPGINNTVGMIVDRLLNSAGTNKVTGYEKGSELRMELLKGLYPKDVKKLVELAKYDPYAYELLQHIR